MCLLIAAAIALVFWVYRRDGRSRAVRISLGTIRTILLLSIIAMLNRPVLTLSQSRTEPSVLPILIDDSLSMRIRDSGDSKNPSSRLAEVQSSLAAISQTLSKDQQLHFYSFDTTAQPIDSPAKLEPVGQNTQVEKSVRSVMEDMQGQRLAGVVVLTMAAIRRRHRWRIR